MKRSLDDFLSDCSAISKESETQLVLYVKEDGKLNQVKRYKTVPDSETVLEDADGATFRLFLQTQNGTRWENTDSIQIAGKAQRDTPQSMDAAYAAIVNRQLDTIELLVQTNTKALSAVSSAYAESIQAERRAAQEKQELAEAIAEAISESGTDDSGVKELLGHVGEMLGKLNVTIG